MINVEEAINLVINSDVQKQETEVNIADALNYVLAKTIYAPINIPSFPQSAMDGYAICGNTKEFNLVDEIQAGDTRNIKINKGEAIRIFTGAPVPIDANAVIMQEKTERENNSVIINDEITEGKNIRPIGEQIKKGNLVFNKYQKLNAAALGLLQSLGILKVKVYKNPAITLIVTGDELKSLETILKYGEIFESNSITILSASKQSGFTIGNFHHVSDNFENTKSAISKALNESDVLLLSGGISVGDYDFVKKALTENGVEEIFYKVKQKPGKPLFFGKKDTKYIFALPGNPAAALTCFYIYVLPLLNKIKGEQRIHLENRKAQINHSYIKKGDRSVFLKGKLENKKIEILDGQSSAMLHSYAIANCLVYIDGSINSLKENDEVDIYILP